MGTEQLTQDTVKEITKTTQKIGKELNLDFNERMFIQHELSDLVNKSLRIANGIFEPTTSVEENWKNLGRKRRA